MLQAGKLGRHCLSLLGKSICAQAWRRLLGVGSSRFWKLSRAARLQLPVPVDGRFVTRRFGGKSAASAQGSGCGVPGRDLQHHCRTLCPERHGGEDDSVNRRGQE